MNINVYIYIYIYINIYITSLCVDQLYRSLSKSYLQASQAALSCSHVFGCLTSNPIRCRCVYSHFYVIQHGSIHETMDIVCRNAITTHHSLLHPSMNQCYVGCFWHVRVSIHSLTWTVKSTSRSMVLQWVLPLGGPLRFTTYV